MALIEQEAAIALIDQKQKELCPVGKFSRHAVYDTDRERFDAWDEIIDQIDGIPTIDPIRAAGGCRCGECRFEEDCEKQVTIIRRDHVLEQNVYEHRRIEWCGAGEPRES